VIASRVIGDREEWMTRRFIIEDLVMQDASGVVFRALDTESGRMTALRRFLPSGTHGGGLLDEERAAYDIALARLSGLHHPALRDIICGGCDPVDGIPFIAAEWIEGAGLDATVRQRPLSADMAVELLTKALELCELLSQVFAEEAVWVETRLDSIVFGGGKSGRGFTFWISPLKWLGGKDHPRGLESFITLTEEIMGWKDRKVNDEAGRGLGAWLNWLRRSAPHATLHEARENLAAAIGNNPPPSAKNIVAKAKRPPARKSSKAVLLAGFGLFLIFTGLGGWLLTRKLPTLKPGPSVELKNSAPKAEPAVAKKARVFYPAESALLVKEKGSVATLVGYLLKTGLSQTGKTTYLYFSENPTAEEVRGALSAEDAKGFNAAPLMGKRIRITGKVMVARGRPEIIIASRAAIELAE
jgi:hypothetical protein